MVDWTDIFFIGDLIENPHWIWRWVLPIVLIGVGLYVRTLHLAGNAIWIIGAVWLIISAVVALREH